jgi:hypothetical protein
MKMFDITISSQGKNVQVPFSMDDYHDAHKMGLSLSQYLNRKVPTDAKDPGTAFEQCMAHSGLVLSENRHYGLRAPTIADILDGKAELNSGAIVRPDGADRHSPAGRYFFPTVLMDVLESELRDDRTTYTSAFMEMVAFTRSINSPRYDQVVIDYTKPRETRAQPISQLAEPVRLLSITTSAVQRALPTWAIGIEISDQAAQASTLDLVQIALREHGSEERALRLNEDFMGIVNGNADAGEAGILGSAQSATVFDSTITTPGTLTQKAWVKWLMQNWMRRRITHAVCNVDTYLAIEGRQGRPVKNDEPAVDERLNTVPQLSLSLIPANVRVFPMEDFPADLVVGLDASKAMRRIIQVSAAYSAIENYVMRRSTAFRIDTSERIESMGYSEAFSAMTLIGAGGTT